MQQSAVAARHATAGAEFLVAETSLVAAEAGFRWKIFLAMPDTSVALVLYRLRPAA